MFGSTIMNPTFIFVDGSYYCYHRYYSLIKWWKNAHKDVSLDDPFQNTIFVEKFQKTFVEKLLQIPIKLKIKNPIMIIGKDCKRENIWRNELYSQYKQNRICDDFKGGPFFKMAYDDNYFQRGGAKAILKHPKLEGDDCIAISVKYLLNKYQNDCTIYIITSDRDYLQLVKQNVHIYALNYKPLRTIGDPQIDLKTKIIMGDQSDNIPSVFPKCGPKTAQKCIDNCDYFNKIISTKDEYYKQYELNKQLIDFNNIPDELVEEFINTMITPQNNKV